MKLAARPELVDQLVRGGIAQVATGPAVMKALLDLTKVAPPELQRSLAHRLDNEVRLGWDAMPHVDRLLAMLSMEGTGRGQARVKTDAAVCARACLYRMAAENDAIVPLLSGRVLIAALAYKEQWKRVDQMLADVEKPADRTALLSGLFDAVYYRDELS